MLSTEAPPPDLSCPCVISQQISGSSNIFSIDERDSDNNQQQLEVDLFKSDLDDNNNNPLPKFSIRDYVSSARGKSIKNNWPFSQKNLQLCLEHGVADVLPPFHSLDVVRNPSRKKCVDVKLPALSDKILSSGFQEGKEFESTTCPSHSNINSGPLIKTPCSKREAVRSSVEKPESSATESRKVEKSTQNSAKNCKLIVKLGKIAEPLSIEHSETMASKVCPVCKTFSSSSNTTLNAHIDQCLSGVSTMDWISNSRVSKHRIKPRKTRLMVDIYATALHCTLEDLDKRNGTNWASNMVFSTQDTEACPKEKKKIDSSSYVEGNEEDAVYVDSSGTKFLSLSKCGDLPFNSNAKDDCGTRRLIVTNKESKFPLRKKRKVLIRRHESLKHSHYRRASSSPGPSHCPEVYNVRQKKLFLEDGYEEECTTQSVKAYDQMESGEMGMVKQWAVGSKLTDFRKISHEHLRPDKTVKNLIVKDGRSSRGNSFIKGTCDSNSPVFSDENALLPSECRKRKENLQYTSHVEHVKQPYLRKRAELSTMKSRDCHGKRNRLALRKCIIKQSRKDCPSLQNRCTDPLSGTENLDFSGSNKRNEINTSTGLNAECSFSNSRMSHHHAFSYGGKDLAYPRQLPLDHAITPGHNKKSYFRKSSATHASAPKSKDNSGNRHLNFKKPRLHYTSDSDDEAVVPRSAICRRDNLVEKLSVNAAQMEKTSVQSSMEPARVLKIRKEGILLNSDKEMDMASMASEISPELDNHGVRKNIDSFMGGNVPASTSNVFEPVKEAEIQDEFVCELISERAEGEAFLAFSKSLDSSFYELAGPSNVKSVSQGYIETYNKHCPAELLLGGEPEMFYADKVAKSMTSCDTRMMGKMDANEGQGNYYVDVDPIPIPGPPGSFLPSPGRMSSEELQGNSSLTTCRIQSSEDKHELMDVDSSDSPISSASMFSESATGRSDSVSAKNLSELSDGIQDQSRFNISEDRVVESSKLSELASHVEGEPDLDESRADLMLTPTNPHIFKNSQPYCRSRKEGAFLKDSFDCDGDQILQRRSTASLALRSQEKHIGGDLSETPHNSNVMSQTPTGKVRTPGAEICMSNSQTGYTPILVSQNSETKFPTFGDCESPNPSTANPVLRLMGKNLMVVNKDETLPPRMTQTHLSMAKDSHPSMLSIVDNGVTTVRFPNEYYSVHQTLCQVPSRYDCMQPSMLAQHLDASSSNCFENTAKIRIQGSIPHPSAYMLASKSFGGSLATSLEHHEFASGSNMTSEFGSSIGPDTPITYGVEKVQTHGHQLIGSTDFSGSKNKETLVINESPKSEPGVALKATHGGSKIEARRSPVGISLPVVFGHESRHVNPAFYNNQTRGYPVCSGSQAFYAANIQGPSSLGIFKANSVQWKCTREGSAILHPNSLTASSPATGHPMSSLYFSPGF